MLLVNTDRASSAMLFSSTIYILFRIYSLGISLHINNLSLIFFDRLFSYDQYKFLVFELLLLYKTTSGFLC